MPPLSLDLGQARAHERFRDITRIRMPIDSPVALS
jgi:hypothetical protein